MEQEFKANEKLIHPIHGEVEYKHEVMDDLECAVETGDGRRVVVSKSKLKKIDSKNIKSN